MRCTLLSILFAASFSLAQSPQLLVRDGEKQHPIALAKADIHAIINGHLALTSMTLTFANDANRVLEGELVFPLPENATVCSYALDVSNELVDAVVVDKQKARVVFETEVRGGIDPGIIEKVQGNNFRTRIYPVPAKGTRTIRVQYVSDLAGVGANQLAYVLPLKWDQAVAQASIRIEVLSAGAAPKASAPGLDGLAFAAAENHFIATAQLKDATLNTMLTVNLPQVSTTSVAVEKRTQMPVSADNLDPKTAQQLAKLEHFFVVNDVPAMLVTGPGNKPLATHPAHIAVLWDASLSRLEIDHKRELAILQKHLATLGDSIVDVTLFRNVPEQPKRFWIKNGKTDDLIKFLSNVTCDGGTNLSAVAFQKTSPADRGENRETLPAISHALLFTDGLSNLGPEMPATIEIPVFAVAIDPRSNHALLRQISSSSGGAYLNLARMSDDQAVAAITAAPFSLLRVEYDTTQIADVYPRGPQPVQGRIALAGKLLVPSAKMTLVYGHGQTVASQQEVTLTAANATETGLIPRFWAQLKLADLSTMEDKNQAEIAALGKQFGLVTSFTSMIVLENIDQYLRHQIIPPKSRPQIYAQFMERIEQQRAVAANQEKAKIDRVVAMWNARVQWWEKEYVYAKDFKYAAPAGKKDAPAAGVAASPEPRPILDPGEMARTTPSARPQQGQPHPTGQNTAPGTSIPPQRPGEVRRTEEQLAHEGESSLRRLEGTVDQLRSDGTHSAAAGRVPEIIDARNNADKGVRSTGPRGPVVNVKEWSPDTPYLKALQAAKPDDAYGLYTDQSKTLRSSPAFFLDCADHFAKLGQKELALRILTNIPEIALEDGRLLRIAAHRMQQLGYLDLAADLFEKVTRLRPEEPQSFRDLALVLADRADALAKAGDADRARSDYQRCLDLLHKVVMNQWQRFEEIEVMALEEANAILARIQRLNTANSALSTLKNPFDPRLIKLLDMDARIVMTWDTDNTDIDLHVVEPSSEVAFYSHNRTTIGGLVSRDFTQGYGPEEYCLRKLMPGQYQIKAHFYGNRDQKLVGPTTVQATIITNFGRPNESRRSLTLRLKDAKEMVDIGTVTLNP